MGQDNSPRIRIPATTFCIFTPLVVATRFWSRRQTNAVLGADDWTILGSMVRHDMMIYAVHDNN
jgi:hypothetical protein